MALLATLKRWFVKEPPEALRLPNHILNYAATSYPSNHTFRIYPNRLIPKSKLYKRFKTLSKLYPKPLTSLLDIGCSKGFFVFEAAKQLRCERALGIDITTKEIQFCNQVKAYLNAERARFELLQLDELASRLHEFGGPFQTVLVINLYQYLFFGSDQYSGCYLNHEMIFKYLSDVCAKRVIFNNRINLADCQNQTWVDQAKEKSLLYNPNAIHHAASQFFTVKEVGKYGRYPLWVLDKR